MHAPFVPSSLRRSVPSFKSAFTLTEILIVIALIVLMLALALPALNFITGGRSIDGAQNNLAAILARARTEAIGLQEIRGVMFFVDPKTPERVSAALVREVPSPTGNGQDWTHDVAGSPTIDVYLDLVPDTDFFQLPKGVGLQLVDDCRVVGGARQDDGYIGFNTAAKTGTGNNTIGNAIATDIQYGGVILFDANGLLTSKTFGFRARTPMDSTGTTFAATKLGELLYENNSATPADVADVLPWQTLVPAPPAPYSAQQPLRSQFGLVLFDLPAFLNANCSLSDAGLAGQDYTTGESGEENNWLDQNATAVLINRYNGTLVKGD